MSSVNFNVRMDKTLKERAFPITRTGIPHYRKLWTDSGTGNQAVSESDC